MSTPTDDKSYTIKASLTKENDEWFVKNKIRKLPGKSFMLGSAYLFARSSSFKLPTNLKALNLTRDKISYKCSDILTKFLNDKWN